jgi:hypothetical protein
MSDHSNSVFSLNKMYQGDKHYYFVQMKTTAFKNYFCPKRQNKLKPVEITVEFQFV